MDWLLHLDFAVLAKIIAIDLVMGFDNAIVIAMAVAALAAHQRNTAIFLGTAGAVAARIVFLFMGFWLLATFPSITIVAGAFLVYLGYKLVNSSEDDSHEIKQSGSIWGAATTIVVADIMLSLDNVVALIGASNGTGDHGFAYTTFGILLSIPIIIFASKLLIKLIERFPILLWCGGALIVWVGAEMVFKNQYVTQSLATYFSVTVDHALELLLAGIVTVVTLLIAFVRKDDKYDLVPNK